MSMQIVKTGDVLPIKEPGRTSLQLPCGAILSYEEVYKPGTRDLSDYVLTQLEGLKGDDFENKFDSLMGHGMLTACEGCREPWEFRYHVDVPGGRIGQQYDIYVCDYHSQYIQQIIENHLKTSKFSWGFSRRSLFQR